MYVVQALAKIEIDASLLPVKLTSQYASFRKYKLNLLNLTAFLLVNPVQCQSGNTALLLTD